MKKKRKILITFLVIITATLSSCNISRSEIPKVKRSDVARFAGEYVFCATINGCSTADMFTLQTDKDSASIFLEEYSFGDGKCEVLKNFYGIVRNDTLDFGWNTLNDKCGSRHDFHAFATFSSDTLIFSMGGCNNAPWHCGEKFVRK